VRLQIQKKYNCWECTSLTQFVVNASKTLESGTLLLETIKCILYAQQEHFHYKTRKEIYYRHILLVYRRAALLETPLNSTKQHQTTTAV
jgi:hypothetical protein